MNNNDYMPMFEIDIQAGVAGQKGDKGDQGIQGIQGEQGPQGEQGIQGIQGVKGDTGAAGNGIASIEQKTVSTEDEGINVWRITQTNGQTDDFQVKNGSKGSKGDKGDVGAKGDTGATGATGNGISSITKTGTSGYVDTYTIAYTDGTSTTFEVTNGEVSEAELNEVKTQLDETTNELDRYKTIYNVLPKITGSGESLTLNNTGEATLKLDLLGNTSQTGTPTPSTPINVNVVSGDNEVIIRGRNLFNFNNYFSKSPNVTIDSSTTNTLKASVTTAATWQTAQYVVENLEKNTNYTFWYNFSNSNTGSAYQNTALSIKDGNGTNLFNDTYHPNDKITVNTGNYTSLRFAFHMTMGSPATTNTITITQAQLEVGTTTGEYQPYQSQTYEVDLGTLELCKIGDYQDYFTKNSGKNILPLTNQDFSIGDLHYSVDNGVLQATGSRSAEVQRNNNNFRGNFKMTLSAGTYKVNYSESGTKTGTMNYYIMKYSDDSEIKRIQTTYDTFTLTEETEVYLGIYSYQLAITGTLDIRIMLCKDDGTTPVFEPYGTGQWCKYNAIGKVVLDGSETWGYYDNYFYSQKNDVLWKQAGYRQVALSNYFTNGYASLDNLKFQLQNQGANGISELHIRNDSYDRNTLNDFKTWLSTLDAVFYYPITPYLSLIEDTTLISQLDNLENAMSYQGTTNIGQVSNDKPFVINGIALKDLSEE